MSDPKEYCIYDAAAFGCMITLNIWYYIGQNDTVRPYELLVNNKAVAINALRPAEQRIIVAACAAHAKRHNLIANTLE